MRYLLVLVFGYFMPVFAHNSDIEHVHVAGSIAEVVSNLEVQSTITTEMHD